MSALSFMCRMAILGFALVALAAGGVYAAQDSAPAKVHRKTTAAAGARRHKAPDASAAMATAGL